MHFKVRMRRIYQDDLGGNVLSVLRDHLNEIQPPCSLAFE